jgi:stage III sporulation protein SpoIIIAA
MEPGGCDAKTGDRKLLRDGVFERAVVLSRRRGPGTVEQVIDVGARKILRGFGGA